MTVLDNLGGNDVDLLRPVNWPTIGSETTDRETMTTYQVPRLQISLKSSPNGISFFSFP